MRVQVPPPPILFFNETLIIMRICINCKHIFACKTYQSIEKQQTSKPSNTLSTFIPQYTIIRTNLNNGRYNEIDWDIVECLSFVENPGYWSNFKIKVKNLIS